MLSSIYKFAVWLFSWLQVFILFSVFFLAIVPFAGINPADYVLYYIWIFFLTIVNKLSNGAPSEKSAPYVFLPYTYAQIPELFGRLKTVAFILLIMYVLVVPVMVFIGGNTHDLYKYWFHWIIFILILYIFLSV